MGAESTRSPLELDSRTKGTTGFLAALASYDTTCREALRFFTRVKIEVNILPISVGIDEQDDRTAIKSQRISVTARRDAIGRCRAKFSIRPIKGHRRELLWDEGPETYLVPDVSVQLEVWRAYLQKDEPSQWGISINTDTTSPIHFLWKETQSIELDLGFVGETASGQIYADSKPRRFSINLESWDELGLAWRS